MSQRTNQQAPAVSGQAMRKGRRKRLAGKEEEAHLPVHSDALAQRQPATTGQRLPLEERQAVVTNTGALVAQTPNPKPQTPNPTQPFLLMIIVFVFVLVVQHL